MRHHQHGRIPGKNSVAVAVEMNDVGTNARRDLQQPIAGTINIVPRILHPFEPVRAFEQAHIFARDHLVILLATETRAHSTAARPNHSSGGAASTCRLVELNRSAMKS